MDGSVPIIRPKPEEGSNVPHWFMPGPKGEKLAYPIVMSHLWSDNGLTQVAEAVTKRVLAALELRGVIPPLPSEERPADVPQGVAKDA